MTLISRSFRGDPALEACLINDSAHLTLGTVGAHIPKIQKALLLIDGVVVDSNEVESMRYGPSTAGAILAYKKKRNIINKSYQSQADNIVGKMTIQSLDKELFSAQGPIRPCPCGDPVEGRTTIGVRGRSNLVGDAPQNLGKELKVGYQFAFSTGKKFVGALRLQRLRPVVEAHAIALLAPWGMTLKTADLGGFEFPFTINPNAPSDVQKIREVAEKAANSAPNVLRVIFARFDDKTREFGVSGGPLYGGVGFNEFVVLNTNKVRLDGGTMTHEMIHCSHPSLFDNNKHDKQEEFPTSVFCSHEGRTEIRKPHAIKLSESFFGK